MHVDPRHWPPAAAIRQNLERFAALGLAVEITEMDVPVGEIAGNGRQSSEQSAMTHDIVAACVALPACSGVTFWGFTDRYSWLNDAHWGALRGRLPHRPLPFDADYRAKPMVAAIAAALAGTRPNGPLAGPVPEGLGSGVPLRDHQPDLPIVPAKQNAECGPRSRWPVVLGCALLAAAACDRRVNLGAIGDGGASLLWSATFEPGNLSEWMADGHGGLFNENINIALVPTATTTIAHSGRYAGLVTLSPAAGMTSTNYLFRNAPAPTAAYYSAWFYIPSSVTIGTWLSLTHFRGSQTADGNNLSAIWDVNLYPLRTAPWRRSSSTTPTRRTRGRRLHPGPLRHLGAIRGLFRQGNRCDGANRSLAGRDADPGAGGAGHGSDRLAAVGRRRGLRRALVVPGDRVRRRCRDQHRPSGKRFVTENVRSRPLGRPHGRRLAPAI